MRFSILSFVSRSRTCSLMSRTSAIWASSASLSNSPKKSLILVSFSRSISFFFCAPAIRSSQSSSSAVAFTRRLFSFLMLIISTGADAKRSCISSTRSVILFNLSLNFLQEFSCFVFCSSFVASCCWSSSMSSSKVLSSNFLRRARVSMLSPFASLNFFSNWSRSKNLARISLRLVEPSLMKVIAPI